MAANSNVTLPAGTTDHGQPGLLCLPTKWTDIVVFFFGNYIAHAATIRLEPGTSTIDTVLAIIWALLIPVSGVRMGIGGILSFAKFGKTDLQVAARAGALCQVIRTDLQARSPRERLLGLDDSLFAGKVHGRFQLPEGFGLAIVPWNFNFIGDDPKAVPITISSNYNVVTILIAMAQLAFAVSTLYRSRGDQTTQYGYAAFGLTVTQYAMMSLLNLLGNLLCPQYPALYLVGSQAMTEAEQIPNGHAVFEGIVGTLSEDNIQASEANRRNPQALPKPSPLNFIRQLPKRALMLPLVWLPTPVSVAITYWLSRFRKGSSTIDQRASTMAWLAVGSWVSALGGKDVLGGDVPKRKIYLGYIWRLLFSVVGSAPSIAGFITVAQMLKQYGICSQV